MHPASLSQPAAEQYPDDTPWGAVNNFARIAAPKTSFSMSPGCKPPGCASKQSPKFFPNQTVGDPA